MKLSLMANNGIKIITSMHFFLLIFSFSQCAIAVEGRKTSTQIAKKHKHAIKTIRTESGDIFDCVSLYKQHTLEHPFSKCHKTQMKKDGVEIGKKEKLAELETVHCPEGTIPILRTPKSKGQFNHNATINNLFNVGVKDALFWIQGKGIYTGLDSYINVWNPRVAYEQDSSGVYSWVQAGFQNNLEIVGAGWMVNPMAYNDNQTRFTVYWTRDNFGRTGCINHNCGGFCQVNCSIALGGTLNYSTSYYNQKSIRITIKQDKIGNWWLLYNDYSVGYWPRYLFSDTGLGFRAESLAWGGKVFDSGHFQGPTYTEMGSGLFPNEGYGRACYIRNMNVFNAHNQFFPPPFYNLQPQVSNQGCYFATKFNSNWDQMGTYIYLGGNGASSPFCQ